VEISRDFSQKNFYTLRAVAAIFCFHVTKLFFQTKKSPVLLKISRDLSALLRPAMVSYQNHLKTPSKFKKSTLSELQVLKNEGQTVVQLFI
jgi:hypothetical protein